jgi:ABC-2 type transport system ATP-binding protein
LDGVNLDVRAGEIFGILGRNGAGKTTTVEIIQGLRTRDSGDVSLLGVDPGQDRRLLRGLVGAQLQSSALPERIKVAEALRLFARLAGNVVDWTTLRDEWGLTRLAGSPFGALSGGERQRLFIALALVNNPRVVFLDELTQGLDPEARRETWRLVRRVREQGASVVLVTHDMVEAEHLCDRIAVLHQGTIRACGTPAELIATIGGSVMTTFSAGADVLGGLDALPGVLEVTHDGKRAGVLGDAASAVLVAAELARQSCLPTDFAIRRPSLDDVFLAMTGADQ